MQQDVQNRVAGTGGAFENPADGRLAINPRLAADVGSARLPKQVAISVVIPAYNAEAFICRALESALRQTLPPVEILVVDDGSNDQTAKLAEQYDPRVQVIRKANGGPASARNAGIERANSEWIALLDADDFWLPSKLEKQVRVIEPGVALVHSGAVGRRTEFPAEITFQELWSSNYISSSSVLILREAFNSAGGFDEDPALIGLEDYNLWLRIVAAGWKIRSISEELIVYAPPANSLSRRLLSSTTAEMANARKIAAMLRLSPDQLLRKELTILDQHGKDLVSVRELEQARSSFGEALQRERTVRRAVWWLATWLPVPVLNWRRILLHGQSGRTQDKSASMTGGKLMGNDRGPHKLGNAVSDVKDPSRS